MNQNGSKFPVQQAIILIFVLLIISLSLFTYFVIDNERQTLTNSIINQNIALTETIAKSVESSEVHLVPAYKVQVVKDVGARKEVVYCRIVKPTGEIYITSNDKEWGSVISSPALYTQTTTVIDDVYNGEKIKAVVSPTYEGYTVWVGFSLKDIDRAIQNTIISSAGIFIGIVAMVFIVFFGLSFVNRELKKAKGYTEKIVSSMADALFILDPDGRITNVNRAAVDLLGFNEQEFFGRPINTIIKIEKIKEKSGEAGLFAGTELEQLVDTGFVRDMTLVGVAKDGRNIPMSMSTAVMKDDDGRHLGYVCIGTDITERNRAEEVLKESEEKYRRFFRTSRDCVFITTIDGQWVDLNDAAVELFGYTNRDELMQVSVPALYANPEERVKHIHVIREQGFSKEYPVDLRRKDGSVMHTLITNVMRYDRDRNAIGFQGTIRDITEWKRNEEALRHINQQLNLLSSVTRHDILNQLLVLKGYLALSQKFLSDKDKIIGLLASAGKAATTIEHQIRFTKDYQDLGIASSTWQNVRAGIQRAVASLPMRAVRVEVDRTDLEVYADPLFDKVFYNLIDNALRYGGDGMTTIRIFSKETETGLTIICEDDGAGITEEEKKHLFMRGYGKNTGFGLFLSREILSITGITITENSAPDNGARFEIVVPKGLYRFRNKWENQGLP